MAAENIESRLKAVLCEALKIEDANVMQAETEIGAIGINSVNFVNTMLVIEDEFGFEFNDDDFNVYTLGTYGKIVTYVENHT